MKVKVLSQRKFYSLVGATILGVLMFTLVVVKSNDLDYVSLFKEWAFYEIGVIAFYMGGNAVSKFAEKNTQ